MVCTGLSEVTKDTQWDVVEVRQVQKLHGYVLVVIRNAEW
jgi:hypothetical protein